MDDIPDMDQINVLNDPGLPAGAENDIDMAIMQYMQPFNPTDLRDFDQRAIELQALQDHIRAQIARLDEEEAELARLYERGDGDEDVDDGLQEEPIEDFASGNEEEVEEEVEMEDDGPEQGRRRTWPRKLRQPYRASCALRRNNWFESSLQWENRDFRAVYCMSKESFWEVVRILQPNSIFQSRGRKPQRPVHHQLAVFLLRYGTAEAHEQHAMLLMSIGAGTVSLYCRRVVRAIREYGVTYVTWPTDEEKEEIKRGFKRICGLDGMIGALDGTLCGLATKPRFEGDSYFSRKKSLSVNVQAIVDHNGRFTAFQSGWAGSRPDVGIWPHMWVFQERNRLFANGECLLADGGYPLSPYVLTPFSRRELPVDPQRRREFNRKISRARIVVEWTFRRLKGRFPALKSLSAVHDIKDTYRAIEAMMILHNICLDCGDVQEFLGPRRGAADHADGADGGDLGDESDEDEDHGAYGGNLLQAGRMFRERCVAIICP